MTASRSGFSIVIALLVACGGSARDTGGAGGNSYSQATKVPADSDRFPHKLHTSAAQGLKCVACHPADAVMAGKVARPGSNDHAPCDTCHKEEFYKPPGKFCLNCHTEINAKVKGGTKMQPYPERGFQRVLASEFSHRMHLDSAAMDGAVGFHVSCGDCHVRDEQSRDPALPGHKQCARCHADKDAAKNKVAMNSCESCHPQRDVGLVRGRVFIQGDLVFAHATHEKDKNGNPIRCDTCHDDIPRSRSVEDVSVPAMQRCAICHEDSARTPDSVRIARCEVCHTQITAGSAPRSHLVGKALPEDHTLEFRKNHGEQAAAKDSRCAFCHDGLSGSPRDSCFQCHNLMKPNDHNLGWREDSHGREAAADRDRCQTCHTSDWCTACHAIPPRSHQPMGDFRLGGHAQAARFDLTSCFACHTFEDTCSSCHRGIR